MYFSHQKALKQSWMRNSENYNLVHLPSQAWSKWYKIENTTAFLLFFKVFTKENTTERQTHIPFEKPWTLVCRSSSSFLFLAFLGLRSGLIGKPFIPCKSLRALLQKRCLALLQFVPFHSQTLSYHCRLCYRTLSYQRRCYQNWHCLHIFRLWPAGCASCACGAEGWT